MSWHCQVLFCCHSQEADAESEEGKKAKPKKKGGWQLSGEKK